VYVLMRRGHRLCLEDEVRLDAFREDRFVVTGSGLNSGFERRLSMLCREHGFEPRSVVAGFIWDDGEWPAGSDVVTLATERVARHAPAHMRYARLVPEQHMPIDLIWREDDDSPVLKTFLATQPSEAVTRPQAEAGAQAPGTAASAPAAADRS
jgi:hypothetical protein